MALQTGSIMEIEGAHFPKCRPIRPLYICRPFPCKHWNFHASKHQRRGQFFLEKILRARTGFLRMLSELKKYRTRNWTLSRLWKPESSNNRAERLFEAFCLVSRVETWGKLIDEERSTKIAWPSKKRPPTNCCEPICSLAEKSRARTRLGMVWASASPVQPVI